MGFSIYFFLFSSILQKKLTHGRAVPQDGGNGEVGAPCLDARHRVVYGGREHH